MPAGSLAFSAFAVFGCGRLLAPMVLFVGSVAVADAAASLAAGRLRLRRGFGPVLFVVSSNICSGELNRFGRGVDGCNDPRVVDRKFTGSDALSVIRTLNA